jgi:hypothetical protein
MRTGAPVVGRRDRLDGGGNGERMKRRKKERRRRKKEARPNRYASKVVSFAGALLWSKGVSEGGVLLSTVVRVGCHVYTPGHHHNCAPPVHNEAMWRSTIGFRYGIICENCFLKGPK